MEMDRTELASSLQDISYTRVTLALDVIRKIPEGPQKGYHELGIIKHQIDLGDTITITPAAEMGLSCSFPGVPENSDNICWQAAELLRSRYGITQSVHIAIDKTIPVQGGLAGGSTNAATTLAMLNQFWHLGLPNSELIKLGRELGMDVPFYFEGGSAFDSEATGVLRHFAAGVSLHFVLVIPPFGVSTKEAYGSLAYDECGKKVEYTRLLERALAQGDVAQIAACMHNDFEISVFRTHPELAIIRDSLLAGGALGAIMSGSGSTIIGLCATKEDAKRLAQGFEKSYIVTSKV